MSTTANYWGDDLIISLLVCPLLLFFFYRYLPSYLSLFFCPHWQILLIQAVAVGILSILTYRVIVRRRGTPQSYLVGYGVVIPICLIFPYCIISGLDLRNKILKFVSVSILPNLTVFHTLEAMYGFSPPGVESSLRSYVLYSTAAMEVAFDPKTGRPVKATAVEALGNLRGFGTSMLLLGAYQSTFGPMRYSPFGPHAPMESSGSSHWYELIGLNHMVRLKYGYSGVTSNIE